MRQKTAPERGRYEYLDPPGLPGLKKYVAIEATEERNPTVRTLFARRLVVRGMDSFDDERLSYRGIGWRGVLRAARGGIGAGVVR